MSGKRLDNNLQVTEIVKEQNALKQTFFNAKIIFSACINCAPV